MDINFVFNLNKHKKHLRAPERETNGITFLKTNKILINLGANEFKIKNVDVTSLYIGIIIEHEVLHILVKKDLPNIKKAEKAILTLTDYPIDGQSMKGFSGF